MVEDAAAAASAIGRRVVVFGQSGSGKTTVSARLAAALGLDHVELDSLFHRAGWQPTPDDEFAVTVADRLAAAEAGWIVDGNYSRVRDVVMPQVDTVIWLRLPFRVVYPRLVRRTVGRTWHREALWNGNHESFRNTFLSRESMLLWGLTNWRPHVGKIEDTLRRTDHHATVIVRRSPAEVEALLRAVEARASAGR